MARPLSWLDRVVPISRIVAESARSHYDRKELQRLFELQPRSAQQLMAALPNIFIGRARLIERQALIDFLQLLNASENPAETFAHMRSEGGKTVRRRLRTLSLQDVTADIDVPPGNITLIPGEIRVRFQTMEELAEAMVYLAVVLQDKLEVFAARYEPASQLSDEEAKRQERAGADAASLRGWMNL